MIEKREQIAAFSGGALARESTVLVPTGGGGTLAPESTVHDVVSRLQALNELQVEGAVREQVAVDERKATQLLRRERERMLLELEDERRKWVRLKAQYTVKWVRLK